MPETRSAAALTDELRTLASVDVGDATRSLTMSAPPGCLTYEMQPPATAEIGIVLCPSFFELKTLQASELRFAEAAARDGMYGRYHQPPGTGESSGAPEDVRFEGRVAAAVDAAERALSEGKCREVVFFGCRLGGAVAIRAAAALGSFAVWDPVLDGATYLKQARRLDRIAAMAGRRKGYERLEDQLRERGWATLLGNVVTQGIYDDLSALRIDAVDGLIGRGLVVCVDDATLEVAAEALRPMVRVLSTESLGRKHLGHLGFSPDDATASVPITLRWLKGGDPR